MQAHMCVELPNKEIEMDTLDESLVREIEKFIFEAWDMDLTGANAINYVCVMARQPSFHVEPVMNDLINRMSDV
jgi:hypothetical protein